jgi:hypothetical protein
LINDIFVGTESGEKRSIDGIGRRGESQRIGLFEFGWRCGSEMCAKNRVEGGEQGGEGGKERFYLRNG